MLSQLSSQLVKFIYIYLILSLSLLITGCGTETISSNELVMRNGIFYKVNSETGFTGKVVGKYPSGQKRLERTFKNGQPNGLSVSWHENGQKRLEETYKDGEVDGLSVAWYESGQEELEGYFKDGKSNGLSILYYSNGQKEKEENYKDDQLNGPVNQWYLNGQKKSEAFFKNGISKKEKHGGLTGKLLRNARPKITSATMKLLSTMTMAS